MKPLIMGILNTTPDSFFDGGKYTAPDAALKRAEDILAQGGDIIDVGGQSTRPCAIQLSEEEETSRAIPVIKAIKKQFKEAVISVDTFNYATAKAALESGASIINDVSALADIRLARLAAEYKTKLVIMHMRGTPQGRQTLSGYQDILKEIKDFFEAKTAIAAAQGMNKKDIIIDPGLGFAKTREQNWFLLENLTYFNALNMPMLIGASRKSFTDKSLELSLKAAKLAYDAKAYILRVHDVKETKDFLEEIAHEQK